MDFAFYLKKQIELHPSMQMQDVVKMCHQAVFGVEHMLADTERAKQYFLQEYDAVPANFSIPLYEPISEDFCRINLAAWKARNLEPEELFELFLTTAHFNVPGTEIDLNNCAKSVEKLIHKQILLFSLEEWQAYYTEYKQSGMPAVHHSQSYRLAEQPSYRLVRKNLLHTEIS